MPTLWDSDLDRKLLLVALDPANKPDWAAVATTMGGDFTSEGVRWVYLSILSHIPSSSSVSQRVG